MKIKLAILAASIALVTPCTSFASEGVYIGGSFAQTEYEESGFDVVKPKVIQLSVGGQVGPYFAVEGRVGTGISSGTTQVGAVDIELEIDSIIGAYAKAIAPLSEQFSLYGLIGFTKVEATATGTLGLISTSLTGSENGISYGVGAALNVSEKAKLTLEWASLLDTDNFEFRGISLGVLVKI